FYQCCYQRKEDAAPKRSIVMWRVGVKVAAKGVTIACVKRALELKTERPFAQAATRQALNLTRKNND
ncbi:hypothetical protein K6U20_08405, partial [Vibrio fluvialis]|uniref:hypothetical protein n=1 Tax=Vibrio fluvialis TaxID=676 RepID=UPI001EEA9F8A